MAGWTVYMGRPIICLRPMRVRCWQRNFSTRAASRRDAPAKDRSSLPDYPARTRFAPSPTGYLHLGSLRTALYCYLASRATGGQFVIRIEDTDRTRIVDDAEKRLFEDLKWAGLSWDEGPDIGGEYGPYRQSERLDSYQEMSTQLLASGRAYRCFCSKESHEHLQMQQSGVKQQMLLDPCVGMTSAEAAERVERGEAHTVRFDSSKHVQTPTRDLVYGVRGKQPVGNFILVKSDGFPTYHFANVVDDHLMKITHVIRGSEWLISTPMHAALYDAFGWSPPSFVHVPLLTDAEGQKLSKRLHKIGIDRYREDGTIPAALLNFVALYGWNPQTKSEVISLDDMVENFTFRFTKGNARVDFKKLGYFQDKHLQRLWLSGSAEGRAIFERATATLVPQVVQLVRDREAARHSNPGDAALELLQTDDDDDDGGGGLVPGLMEEGGGGAGLRRRVEELLRLDVGRGAGLSQDAGAFVARHRFLLWRPGRALLARTARDAGCFAPGGAPDGPVFLAEALKEIGQDVAGFEADSWEGAEALDGRLDGAAERWAEALCGGGGEEQKQQHRWRPWKLLRWVLSAGDSGPPLGAYMALLGREETMARVDVARSVAAELGGRKTGEAKLV